MKIKSLGDGLKLMYRAKKRGRVLVWITDLLGIRELVQEFVVWTESIIRCIIYYLVMIYHRYMIVTAMLFPTSKGTHQILN